ncbi:DUF3575 domain-containing protein [Aquimarina sp. 2304DJ70-9]|uniref:DUF3575 domain-containing protein n=1 Tax=Aquimarina penaris TaxID=3231044 RepID=UPI0034635687
MNTKQINDMIKKVILITFLLSSIFNYAQDSISGVENHQFKFNLLITPSIEYEMRLTKNTSLALQLGTELWAIENGLTGKTRWGLYLNADAYYRYYYNFKRRTRKGKNTLNNSANFVGILAKYIHTDPIIGDTPPDDAYYAHVGPVYGLQRTFWKRFNLAFDIGIAYAFSDIQSEITPIGDITLGWVLK